MLDAEMRLPVPFLPVEIRVPERTTANLAVHLGQLGQPAAETVEEWRKIPGLAGRDVESVE